MTPRYRVYGVTLATTDALAARLLPSQDAVDVTFLRAASPPDGLDLAGSTPLYEEPPPTVGRPGDFRFHRLQGWDVIEVTGGVEYWLSADTILCRLHDERWAHLVPVHLFGMVLALWLERRGIPCLHGSAVEVSGQGVVFLASKGAGKTTTAAHLSAHGHGLLTDDLVALEHDHEGVRARPGYPELRLWPDQLHHFLDRPAGFPKVRPDVEKVRVPVGAGGVGRMASDPVPVTRIYLPMRAAADGVHIEPVPPAQALLGLVRHSFLPNEVERYGLQAARLPVLSGLLAQARVAVLRYPDGLDRLEELREAVQADVADRRA